MTADYISLMLGKDRIKLLSLCRETIKREAPDVRYFVGTGMSGHMLCHALAPAFPLVDIIYVRKVRESEHSSAMIEGIETYQAFPDKWIILDDLAASGETLGRILTAMENYDPAHSNLIGTVLYWRVWQEYRKAEATDSNTSGWNGYTKTQRIAFTTEGKDSSAYKPWRNLDHRGFKKEWEF